MPVNHDASAVAPRTPTRTTLLLLRLKAKALLVLGLRGPARAVFEEIATIYPQDVLAINSLGYDALNADDLPTALRYFEKAVHLTPASTHAHFNHGFVLEALGFSERAEHAFRHAVRIDEKMDRAWYGLGLALVRQRRFPEAIEAFKRNTQLQSMSPFAWYQMARVYMEMKQPEEALTVMRHLNGFEPKVAAQLERETGLSLGAMD
ncbi:tetratricopeptide repeat protein [Rhodoferax sp.]|uniref:tetratricopeptide repeat protein n=1 Tax=Rhodoferax sp. TaxID=50421 RepID=UPI0025CC770F|nr:tetratricopeptide repeat protein [Rhodoferax sp.]